MHVLTLLDLHERVWGTPRTHIHSRPPPEKKEPIHNPPTVTTQLLNLPKAELIVCLRGAIFLTLCVSRNPTTTTWETTRMMKIPEWRNYDEMEGRERNRNWQSRNNDDDHVGGCTWGDTEGNALIGGAATCVSEQKVARDDTTLKLSKVSFKWW